ncbi:TetR family transcriptional regulator [Streptomyces sp. NPDC097704]|uniref:TetR family transcriptional regulator n=1 Tax=Streptomyces sp. NPDC097704 TaxID=3157101 RepID=UPI0033211EBA
MDAVGGHHRAAKRSRLLEVAEAVFAARGAGASTEETAREAKAGITTVFRHFPTGRTGQRTLRMGRMQRAPSTETTPTTG